MVTRLLLDFLGAAAWLLPRPGSVVFLDSLNERDLGKVEQIDTLKLFLHLYGQGNRRVFYLIRREDPAYRALRHNPNVVPYSPSVFSRCFWLLARAKRVVYSFEPPPLIFEHLPSFKRLKTQLYFSSHGINFLKPSIFGKRDPEYSKSGALIDKFIVTGSLEKDFIQEFGGYGDEDFIEIGLPRLHFLTNDADRSGTKDILYAPTFVKTASPLVGARERKIEHTPFLSAIKSFVSSTAEIVKKNGIRVHIVIHHGSFFTNRNRSEIEYILAELDLPDGYDLANTSELSRYIQSCDLVISDFSSIVWDFLYLGKPVIFYRPNFLENRYDRVDIEDRKYVMSKDALLPNAVYTDAELRELVENYVENGFSLEAEYREFLGDNMFDYIRNRSLGDVERALLE